MTRNARQTLSTALLLSLAAAGGPIARAAPEDPAASGPPLSDPALVEAGRQRFAQACTYCHGKEGVGGKTKSFKGRDDLEPRAVFDTIANGRKRGANIMPPWKSALSEAQIWELVAYILSLGNAPVSK